MANVFLGLEKNIQLKNINKTFSESRIIKMLSEARSSGSWGIWSSCKSSTSKVKPCGYSNVSIPGEVLRFTVGLSKIKAILTVVLGFWFIYHSSPARGLHSHQWLKVHGILYLPHNFLFPERTVEMKHRKLVGTSHTRRDFVKIWIMDAKKLGWDVEFKSQ